VLSDGGQYITHFIHHCISGLMTVPLYISTACTL